MPKVIILIISIRILKGGNLRVGFYELSAKVIVLEGYNVTATAPGTTLA